MGSAKISIGRTELKNPIICGSGEHVMTDAGIVAALGTGVAAVVAKSVNETQEAKDQLDRTDYALLDSEWNSLPWDFSGPSNATLACRSGLQTMDFEAWLKIISRLDALAARSGQFVIASIILADLQAAVEMAQKVEASGIRVLEFNIGTPYGDEASGIVTTERMTERVTDVVQTICSAVDIPVWVKITGQSENVAELAEAARQGGAEAVVLMGRFLGMIPDLDSKAPLLGTNLGTGGSWALPMTCYWLSRSRKRIGKYTPLIGMNGVRSGKDAIRMILAGAHAVEISSYVFTNGFGVLSEALTEIEDYLHVEGETIQGLIGRAADQVSSFSGLPSRPGHWKQFAPPGSL